MRAALILLLSTKMCTFIHSNLRYVVNKKVTIRAEYQARYSALIFGKNNSGQQDLQKEGAWPAEAIGEPYESAKGCAENRHSPLRVELIVIG